MVPQEPHIFPNLTVQENLTIGLAGDANANAARASAIADEIGLKVDFAARGGELSIANQQLVEIVRGLMRNARVLILDEPTSSLTKREVASLRRQIANLTAKGIGILFISHRLNEVLAFSDRISVLRDGHFVLSAPAADLNADMLVQAMLPEDFTPPAEARRTSAGSRSGAPVLEVKDLSGRVFRNVSFVVWPGEVVGVSGVVGSGRTELAQAIYGVDPEVTGEVVIAGRSAPNRTPRRCQDLGLSYVPEDRHAHGIFLALPAAYTISAGILALGRSRYMSGLQETVLAGRFVDWLRIKLASPMQFARHALRRQSAEDRIGQDARHRAAGGDPRRAHARHRRPRPAGRLPHHPPARRRRRRRGGDFVRGRRDRRGQRPDHDHGARPAQRTARRHEDGGADHGRHVRCDRSGSGMRKILRSRELLVLVLLVAVILAVATVNKAVLYPITLINIVNVSMFLMLIAIGEMFVILTRGIDVSVGAIAGLSAVIFGLSLNAGLPLLVCMALSLITGALAGMVNAVGVAFVGIPPIIMTLGTLGVYRGFMRVLTGGSWIESIPQSVKSLAVTRYMSVPLMVWAVLALVTVVAILLWKVKAARYFYAVGDNRDGAYLLGINVRATEFAAYTLAGLFSGAAAIVFTGQIGFVPMQTGSGQELKAIAAVVLGGVGLMGGTGNIFSAVVGVLFLTTVDSMMIFLHVPGSWNNAVAGAVLLAVVVVDYLIRRAVRKRHAAARATEVRRSETEVDARFTAEVTP